MFLPLRNSVLGEAVYRSLGDVNNLDTRAPVVLREGCELGSTQTKLCSAHRKG